MLFLKWKKKHKLVSIYCHQYKNYIHILGFLELLSGTKVAVSGGSEFSRFLYSSGGIWNCI